MLIFCIFEEKSSKLHSFASKSAFETTWCFTLECVKIFSKDITCPQLCLESSLESYLSTELSSMIIRHANPFLWDKTWSDIHFWCLKVAVGAVKAFSKEKWAFLSSIPGWQPFKNSHYRAFNSFNTFKISLFGVVCGLGFPKNDVVGP